MARWRRLRSTAASVYSAVWSLPTRSWRRARQVARGERDLGLGDLVAGLGESLSGAEAARGAPQELAARSYSPSFAIAMPRRASAIGSSRSATRLSAPSGSPAASERAAEAMRESMVVR